MQWTYSLEQLPTVAADINAQLSAPVICFQGPMGVGKTTLIKALCAVMGCADAVNSPTFSLVNTYKDAGGNAVHHFDCYRLNHLNEALDMGIEEYLDSGQRCFIEWPELIAPLLEQHQIIELKTTAEGTRQLTLHKS